MLKTASKTSTHGYVSFHSDAVAFMVDLPYFSKDSNPPLYLRFF